jgi:hypothetical protein
MYGEPFTNTGFEEMGYALICCQCGLGLVVMVLMAIAGWFIFKKAGFEPALGLLMGLPLLNLIMILYVAFSKWPIERELDYHRDALMHSAQDKLFDGESSLFDDRR